MYMTMTIVRPGLFFQREGPGSEPGNSLLCPDEDASRSRGRSAQQQPWIPHNRAAD